VVIHSEISELVMILQQMTVLLRDYDNVFWAGQLNKCIADLEAQIFLASRGY
jgi:hypothetical protein